MSDPNPMRFDNKQTNLDIVALVRDRFNAAKQSNNTAWPYQDYQKIALMETGYDDSKSQNIKGNNDRVNKLKINLYDVALKTQLGLLNDNPFDLMTYPKHPKFELDAIVYQQGMRWELEKNKWQSVKRDTQYNMMIYGTGIVKLSYKDKDKGIEIINCDTRNVVCSGITYTQHSQLEYIIEITRYSKEEIYKQWGVEVFDEAENQNLSNYSEISQFNMAERNLDKRFTSVYEAWFYEPDNKKYKNQWRYVVCTDYTILEDRPSDYVCGHPYIFIPCFKVPDRIFGIPYIHHQIPMVSTLNTMYRRLDKIIEKTVNPIKVVDGNAVNPTKITNEAGALIIMTDPNKNINQVMHWEYPPQMPGYYIDMMNKMEYYWRMTSGVQDISLGQAQINSGTPSGKSLEQLSQSTQTPLRDISRNWAEGLTELYQKLMSLMHQTMSDDALIRITGADAQEIKQVMDRQHQEVVQMAVKAGAKTKEEIKLAVDTYFKHDLGIQFQETKQATYMTFIADRLGDPNEFDIDVRVGTDTPKNKVDIAQIDTQLFGAGKIDLQSYLEAIDHPDKEKIMQRSGEWQAFQQFQAQQQAQEKMKAGIEQQQAKEQMKAQMSAPQANAIEGEQQTQGMTQPSGPPQQLPNSVGVK